MVTDPIADFITRLKNASDARKEMTSVPYSKLKAAIAVVLEREGYVKSVAKKGKKVKKTLEVELMYTDKKPRIQGVLRVSKLSRRVYLPVDAIHSVKNGFGALILSTPKGIFTDREARKERVGGEALFKIW